MKDLKINKVTAPEPKFNAWDVDSYEETGIYLTDEGLFFAHKEKLVVKYICSVETAERMDRPTYNITYLEIAVLLFALGIVMAILLPIWS